MAKEYIELIRCKDCKHFDGYCYCEKFGHGIQDEDYCSHAERKESTKKLDGKQYFKGYKSE